jgi:hypothetical protein
MKKNALQEMNDADLLKEKNTIKEYLLVLELDLL